MKGFKGIVLGVGVGRFQLWLIERICDKAVDAMVRTRTALNKDEKTVKAYNDIRKTEETRQKLREDLIEKELFPKQGESEGATSG